MSQFYDQASLVMIPSGVKDGKVYSQKPLSTDGQLTFSRGADIEATRVNSQGYIEKAKVNLLLQSNSFDTTWGNSNTTETGGQADKDGGTSAWKLDKSAASGYIIQSLSITGVHTFSVYAKAGTLDWIRLNINLTTGTDPIVYFNLSSGTVGSTPIGEIDAKIQSVGGGWYRCSVTANGTIQDVRFFPADGDNDVSGTSGNIYIQDAQLNYGLVAQDYVETTTAAVVTGITNDMPRLNYDPANPTCPSLLLEPSRTNLMSYSEYAGGFGTSNTGVSIEENATTSPEGVVNAAKIKEDGTNASHAVRQLTGPTLTSGTDYTFSFFAKKGERTIVALSNTVGASNDVNCFFDLENGQVLTNTFNSASIEDFGNGWYRCIATDTADAADDYDTRIYTATADNQFTHQGVSGSGLYIFGIQLEAGSYPTSYIPTYGTSATRTADAASKTGISSLIGQTEGTLYSEFVVNGFSNYGTPLCINNGATSESIWLTTFGNGDIRAEVYSASQGGIQASFTKSGNVIGQTYKIAIGYASNNFAFFVNGEQVGTTDTSGAIPTSMSRVDFDYTNPASYVKSALEIKQALVFKTRLSNADLATLTA